MATASAGRAGKGSSRRSRAFGTSLEHDRLAVGGQGRGEEKAQGQTAELLRPNARSDHERPGNRRAARQGALRRRAGAHAAAMEARPEGEHQTFDQRVVGSIPTALTKLDQRLNADFSTQKTGRKNCRVCIGVTTSSSASRRASASACVKYENVAPMISRNVEFEQSAAKVWNR
jgi:hypothetical protein